MNRAQQQGLSLVELMLAMTVGLLLMGFIIQAFVANKAANRFNDALSHVQESGRYGIDLLRSEIRMSGYRLDPTTAPVANALVHADNTGSNDSDSLTIRYQADVNGTDCVGNPIIVGGVITNTFDVRDSNDLTRSRPSLFCNGVEILPGVENMQFEFGEDLTGDGAANSYVANGANMNNVVAVRVAILLVTEDNVGSETEGRRYSLLSQLPLDPFDDKRLRRVFSLGVVIRNN